MSHLPTSIVLGEEGTRGTTTQHRTQGQGAPEGETNNGEDGLHT